MQKTPPLSTAQLQFKKPIVERGSLSDGTPVIMVPRPDQDLVAINIYLRAGSAHDAQPGAHAFAAELLTQGTTTLDAENFTETVEALGATIRSSGDRSTTVLSALCLQENVDEVVRLWSDALLRPAFAPEELALLKNRWISEIQLDMSTPDWLASAAANQVFYANHPYRNPRRGTFSSIRELSIEAIKDAHQHLLASERTIIVAAPNPADAVCVIDENLKQLPAPQDKQSLARARVATGDAVIATNLTAVQTAFRIGLPAPPFSHPDYPALQLVTAVLGGSTLSRLFTILREEKGYTYGAYAVNGNREHSSLVELVTSVGNEFTADTVQVFYDELLRISTEPIGEEEFENARQHILGSFARQNETSQQTMNMLWTVTLHGLRDDYFTVLVDKIQRYHPNDMLSVQERYFSPSNWAVGASGVPDVVKPALDGKVTTCMEWNVKDAYA